MAWCISPPTALRPPAGVAHGFSTRLGGVSEGIYATLNLGMNRGDAPDRVRENYRRFCAAIGADMGNIVCASQVHGDTVRTVTAADLGIGLDERSLAGGWPCHRHPRCDAGGLLRRLPAHPAL